MKIDDLKFVRFTTDGINDSDRTLAAYLFSRIPAYLFEQVKDTDFKVERIYQFGPMLLASPLTFLYVLTDKETSLIKGVLWTEFSPLSEQLVVHIFSIDKEYQNDGAMEMSKKKLLEIKEQNKISGSITTVTTRPKAVEKAGWKRSDKIVMEIRL